MKYVSLVFLSMHILMFQVQGTAFVIPVAYLEGEGHVLFVLPPNIEEWRNFSIPHSLAKKKEVVSQALGTHLYQALKIKDIQDENIQIVQIPPHVAYIVNVPSFVSGSPLYTTLIQTKKVNYRDLRWVPIDHITYGKPIFQSHHAKGETVSLPVNTAIVHKDPLLQILASYSSTRGKSTSAAPHLTQVSACNWNTLQPSILFYDKRASYYEFTNFYEGAPLQIEGITWPTTEHYYQAKKFKNVQDQRQFESDSRNPRQGRVYPTARDARDAGQSIQQGVKALTAPRLSQSEWHAISLTVMTDAVRSKFTQYPQLKNILLQTGNKILVENAGKNDDFFGNGPDGNGKNHLGQILMHIREELFAQEIDQYPQHIPLLPEVYDAVLYENKYIPYTPRDACWFAIRLQDIASDSSRPKPLDPQSPLPVARQALPVQQNDTFQALLTSLQELLKELHLQLEEKKAEETSMCVIS